ncbi:MAG: class I SAM-dependent methyltransferase, partial [Pedobacter sp.]|nr:class I SAM-dependent methyltransferase [Chitinophagaceae bacterium]
MLHFNLMGERINYKQCPSCGSTTIQPVLAAKDFTVTNEVFEIWHCNDCTLRFTQGIPTSDEIGTYYQSTSYVSHSDSKEGLINRLYHLVRNYTLKGKLKMVQELTGLPKGTLLDVGAGTGYFSQIMK